LGIDLVPPNGSVAEEVGMQCPDGQDGIGTPVGLVRAREIDQHL
jgi:hypothetical protein